MMRKALATFILAVCLIVSFAIILALKQYIVRVSPVSAAERFCFQKDKLFANDTETYRRLAVAEYNYVNKLDEKAKSNESFNEISR